MGRFKKLGYGKNASGALPTYAKAESLFVYTDATGPQLLTLTGAAVAILKPHMPKDAACVYDDAMSCYKITMTLELGDER